MEIETINILVFKSNWRAEGSPTNFGNIIGCISNSRNPCESFVDLLFVSISFWDSFCVMLSFCRKNSYQHRLKSNISQVKRACACFLNNFYSHHLCFHFMIMTKVPKIVSNIDKFRRSHYIYLWTYSMQALSNFLTHRFCHSCHYSWHQNSEAVSCRAANEGSRSFHNHGEGLYKTLSCLGTSV